MSTVALGARQAVELFHLAFLRALAAKGEDKSLFALKGGCNLRFYFGSVRYSEDIDLDVRVVAKETLKNKVDRLLKAPLLTAPLAARGVEIAQVSSPKQTDTTQRWKAALRVAGSAVTFPTQIEFSRRGDLEGASFDAVSRELVMPYGMTPFLANHYGLSAAVAQKAHALAGRTEPQARDVFDLNHLLSRPDARGLCLPLRERSPLDAAIENTMGIGYDEYAARVVAYLDAAQAEPYASREAWSAMKESVVAGLEALA